MLQTSRHLDSGVQQYQATQPSDHCPFLVLFPLCRRKKCCLVTCKCLYYLQITHGVEQPDLLLQTLLQVTAVLVYCPSVAVVVVHCPVLVQKQTVFGLVQPCLADPHHWVTMKTAVLWARLLAMRWLRRGGWVVAGRFWHLVVGYPPLRSWLWLLSRWWGPVRLFLQDCEDCHSPPASGS